LPDFANFSYEQEILFLFPLNEKSTQISNYYPATNEIASPFSKNPVLISGPLVSNIIAA